MTGIWSIRMIRGRGLGAGWFVDVNARIEGMDEDFSMDCVALKGEDVTRVVGVLVGRLEKGDRLDIKCQLRE